MTRTRMNWRLGGCMAVMTIAAGGILAGSVTADETFGGATITCDWSTVDGGGGVSSAATWSVHGTIAQPDAAGAASATWTLAGGFWAGGESGGPTCPTDLDGSGATDFGDLLSILGSWGACPGCPADLDGNDAVDFSDLLQILSAWGPCP